MENEAAPVIVLAGGKSSRMGQPKGLVPHQGRPWLESQLASLADRGLREAIVILGFDSDRYLETLPWLKEALTEAGTEALGLRVRALINPRPEHGPFSSIQAAAGFLRRDSRPAAWILPVDVPCPGPEVWSRLSASIAQVSVPVHGGRGGHPVRVRAEFLERLLGMPDDGPDSRLDHQIHLLGAQAERLEVPGPDILKNLNSPGDWEKTKA